MYTEVHDLLAIKNWRSLNHEQSPSPWVKASLADRPYVVVRRAEMHGEMIPVGVRGVTRSERSAAYVHEKEVAARYPPEKLANCNADLLFLPEAQQTFRALKKVFDGAGFIWGPVGSAGFELVSRQPTMTENSDFDIVIKTDQPFSRKKAQQLVQSFGSLSLHVDAQVQTKKGAFLLQEFAEESFSVLLRTMGGPRLVADPWED